MTQQHGSNELPFNPRRELLYTPLELLEIRSSSKAGVTLDFEIARGYAAQGGDHCQDFDVLKLRAEHDTHLLFAARLYLSNKRVVGFMGGHSLHRDSPGYASCARIARALSRRGFLILNGGGPGAMEASSLGSYFAGMPDEALDDALRILSEASSHLDPQWLAKALLVRLQYPRSQEDEVRYPCLGVATWLYSSEPTNVFPSKIAKMFLNALREDFLVNASTYGIIFFQGSLGTMQEMFQFAALVHYKILTKSPLLFFNSNFWQEVTPVYPLLRHIASRNGWGEQVRIFDDETALTENVVQNAGTYAKL